MTYTYDSDLDKWVVLIADVVIEICDTEAEAKQIVWENEKPNAPTLDPETNI